MTSYTTNVLARLVGIHFFIYPTGWIRVYKIKFVSTGENRQHWWKSRETLSGTQDYMFYILGWLSSFSTIGKCVLFSLGSQRKLKSLFPAETIVMLKPGAEGLIRSANSVAITMDTVKLVLARFASFQRCYFSDLYTFHYSRCSAKKSRKTLSGMQENPSFSEPNIDY